MPKPRYPYQPFIDVNITDVREKFFDRIFIPEDIIDSGNVRSDFFIRNLQSITARLGYPFTTEVLDNSFGFIGNIDKDNIITIDTKSELIGLVTIDYMVVGIDNVYEPDLSISEDSESGISVASYITEMARHNNYRYDRQFLTSKIAIMVLPVDTKLTGSKFEWLHYHINNFMNRGYKVVIENESVNGFRLQQYILDAQYTNCIVITEGPDKQCEKPLNHQPIEAVAWEPNDKKSVEGAMRKIATHLIDPSSDLIKQTTALVALNY